MIFPRNYLVKELILFCTVSLFFLLSFSGLFAGEIQWVEVANTNNEIQFIDSNSIKYNNRGILSVITKYSRINPDDQKMINPTSYLMVIDCENRLFNKLPINGNFTQVKNWIKPNNDKLTKTVIINTCAY
tara:strand:+ start:231 stop:620 length:390 start_codon:yes stop_codon:yes gene_type:complete